jgi:hypothetical protein
MADETEAPNAPDASSITAAGAVTEQAVSSGAGASPDVAVTSETGGKSTSGGKSATGGKSKSGGKDKKGKKEKKGKSSAGEPAEGSNVMTLAAHPQAAQRVAEAKAWGGLAGFMLGGYLSLSTYTPVEAGLRALAAGLFCYMAVWAAAVFAWRRIVVAELRQAEQDLFAVRVAARLPAEPRALPSGERASGSPSP